MEVVDRQVKEVIKDKIDQCMEQDPEQTMAYLRANLPMLWSWGATRFVFDKSFRLLQFFVRGRHHHGHVWIFLNGSNLFDFWLSTPQGRIKAEVTDLYFDQLAEEIDKAVEYIPEYTH